MSCRAAALKPFLAIASTGLAAPAAAACTPIPSPAIAYDPGLLRFSGERALAIERARRAHPEVRFRYAWPIPIDATASFLADHIARAVRDASDESRLV